jgi:hypothetical protein
MFSNMPLRFLYLPHLFQNMPRVNLNLPFQLLSMPYILLNMPAPYQLMPVQNLNLPCIILNNSFRKKISRRRLLFNTRQCKLYLSALKVGRNHFHTQLITQMEAVACNHIR